MTAIDPAFGYSSAHHDQYLTEGYCFFDTFLTAEGLAELRERVDDVIERRHADMLPENMISVHHQEPWMFEFACEPQILDLIEHQIGPNIVLWSSHLLVKLPRSGRHIPWHQDAPYWDLTGKLPGGIWIALDDVDDENGTMSVLPGWHTRGTLPRRETEDKLFHTQTDPSALPDDVDELRVETRLNAGQLAIHHPMIPHCSSPNRSDRPRRVLVLRYMTADGEGPDREYRNYQTLEKFPREFFLVRGDDMAGLGRRRSPLE